MADAQRTIDLIFNGVDKTSAATQAVLNNLGEFGGRVQSATQPLADFTVGALKLEAGILAAGAAVVGFAVNAASDFDSAFRQIATLFEATDEDIANFRQSILDYAQTSTSTLAEITESISAAVGAGVDYSKSIDLISTAERLAISTRADLKGATEVLVSTLNAYGMSTDEASTVSDKLFKIIADGKIEMTDLSASLANITPIAATAGISLDEIGAGIATLTAAGVQPSTAIDALRSAISNIIKPSEQAKAMAEQLGIEFDANALKSKGLAGVLAEVQTATGGSADKMAILFGDVQGLSAVMTLTGTQADTFRQSIENMGNSTGATAEAYARMAGSLEGSTARIASAFQVLQVAIGDRLLNEFGGIADAIAQVFVALAGSVQNGNLGELVQYIESIAGDIEEAFQAVARNLPAALESADFSGVKGGIDAVLSAVQALFGNIDLSTIEGLTKAIEFLGAAFLGLSQYAAGVIESFEPMFDLLVKVGQGAAGVDADIFKLAGNIGGAATQINLLAGGLNGLVPWLETLLGLLVVKQGAGLVGAMISLAGSAGTLTTALGQAGLVGAAGAAGYAIGTALNEPINDLVSNLTGTKTTLGGWIYDLVNASDEAEQFGVSVGGMKVSIEELNKGVESGRFVWDDVTQAWTLAAKESGKLSEGLDGVAGAVTKVTTGPVTDYIDAMGNVVKRTVESQEALDAWNKAILEGGGVLDNVGAGTDKLGKAIQTTGLMIDAATGAINGYYGAFEDLTEAEQNALLDQRAYGIQIKDTGDKTAKAAEELKKAEEATRAWNLEMAKLESAEVIASIEAATTLGVARIEADAQKMIAAFESINNTVTSTGETLVGLFDILGNSDLGIQDWRLLTEEIEKESTRRDEALKLQNELTTEQIEMMRAQREALERGDSLITVDGAGLQPHLEAFMWEILQAIQVRVNRDGLEMLLGV